mgnify:CR=1 FL=1
MAEKAEIHVQVCYARPDVQFLRDLIVPFGSTLHEAIHCSGVLACIPDIDLSVCRVGIYGKLKELDTVLREDDRVEIYRSLVADPKDSRRQRADKKKR